MKITHTPTNQLVIMTINIWLISKLYIFGLHLHQYLWFACVIDS